MRGNVQIGFADSMLQDALERSVAHLVEQFGDCNCPTGIHPDSLSITAVDLGTQPSSWAHHNGERLTYPASIIKLFYVVASHVWEDAGKLTPSAELERARQNAIVHSSNDATSYLLDALTGTTSGPELSPTAFQLWQDRRNVLNRYFHQLGLPGNFCQKTWTDGPYGRDRQSYELNHRNALTSNGTAWLLNAIISGQAVTPQRSQAVLDLMARDLEPSTYIGDPDNQIQGFLGEGLPREAKLWSKAGETSFSRHDCALIQLPHCSPFILVVFGDGPAYFENWKWLPALSRFWLEQMQQRAALAV